MEEYLETKTKDIPININPFERRDSITRSPPGPSEMSLYPATHTDAETSEKETESGNEGQGMQSIPDTQRENELKQPFKRRRTDNTPVQKQKSAHRDGVALKNSLDATIEQVTALNEMIKDSYKPKVKLTEIAKRMNLHIKRLQTEEQKKWLKNAISATGETQKVVAPEKRDIKTTNTHIDKEVQNRVQAEKIEDKLKEITTEEEMSALTEEDWPEEVFQAIKRIEGNMLNTKGNVAVYIEEEQMWWYS
ncbi:hypothetical protein JTB14_038091 [Gonioctena quinquepunctata]|nr:hypothetical protein JTB14_038091 [Gonioctena quinquepunctata]